jgi:hypothetical protein
MHHGTTAYGPEKNLLLWKVIRILSSGTKIIIKCQMSGDDSEIDYPPEDVIAGIKLYERMHPPRAAEDAAPPAATVPAPPRTANKVIARFGLQDRYTGSEFFNSNFFSSCELDLTKLVQYLGSSPPPCENSGTLFKRLLCSNFTSAIRVMPQEDESGPLYGFIVDAVYDVSKQTGKGVSSSTCRSRSTKKTTGWCP